MNDLTEEQEQEMRRVLNSIDEGPVNLLYIDRKYGEEWYTEKIHHLREMEQYLAELHTVMNECDRRRAAKTVKSHRENVHHLIEMYEDALKEWDDRDNKYNDYNT